MSDRSHRRDAPKRSPSPAARRARLAAVLPTAALAVLMLGPRPAWACSCGQFAMPSGGHISSGATFVGRVADTNYSDGSRSTLDFPAGGSTTFSVIHVLGGGPVNGATIEVHHGLNGAACGVVFEIGKIYRVSATMLENGSLSTGLCSFNTRLIEVSVSTENDRRCFADIDEEMPVVWCVAPPKNDVPVKAAAGAALALASAAHLWILGHRIKVRTARARQVRPSVEPAFEWWVDET